MVELPEGVSVRIEGGAVVVKGPKGEERREFRQDRLKPDVKGRVFEVAGEAALAKSLEGHVMNLAIGVTQGYSRRLKAIYAHFPVSFEVKGKELLIKNFLGEKQPRKANIIGSTKLEAKGTELAVSGTNREHVGQTIANIKSATKIRRRDSRVFQDGLYEVELA